MLGNWMRKDDAFATSSRVYTVGAVTVQQSVLITDCLNGNEVENGRGGASDMTRSEEQGCGHERTVQTKTDYVADVGTSGGEESYGRE
jgi:hypothetical protein